MPYNVLSRLPVSVSFIALAAALPTAAFAQTADAPAASAAAPAAQTDAPPVTDSTTAATATTPSAATTTPADEPTNDQAIVVTGSRIARPDFQTIQPTQVIGAAQIENRGYTNVGQALNELPAFGPPGNSAVGAQSSFGPAQTFVDFFGLGTQRTLVLVNGRRFVSSNTASIFGPVSPGSQVDLNNIPTTLVSRIETVAVGGAPIYGSDAIAGTVNIILKRNFEGVRVEGQTGISQRGDAPDYRVSVIAGHNFAGGRGNITLSGEYNTSTGLTAGDRAITAAGNFFGSPPTAQGSTFQTLLYPSQRYTAFTSGGVPFRRDDYLASRSGIRDANGNLLQFGPGGTLIPLDLGTVLRQGYVSSGGNGFNLPAQANLLTSSERYLGTALASYQLTDHVRVFGEAWYAHTKGVNLIDQPNYNTALFDAAGTPDGNIIASVNNPFLSAADRATIQANLAPGQTNFYIGRALSDLTTGRAQANVETYRFVGGLDGDFSVGSKNFKWEASANYGRSRTEGRNYELVQQNFENALNAVRDPSGNIVCAPGYTNAPIATISATCAPLNIFGVGQASQAARNYIFAIASPVSVNSQLVLNANVTGPIAHIWGGDVQVSLGYEHRRESTSFDPGAYYYGHDNGDGTRSQYGRTIPIDPISGSFHTNEIFGELRVPIVSPDTGLRFLKTLELDGAARYVWNSLSGGDLTWTAGGRLGFIRDLTFRGNFTRSIRSPAITEAFNPTSSAFDVGSDPCDMNNVGSGPNPSRREANCRAAGINPATFISDYSNFTVPVTVSGNPGLKNEVADSWTVGAIFQPRFLPGFSAAVDWVDIKLKNAIVSLGGDAILNACYDASNYPNNFCGLVDRDANGQITMIREGYYNAASYRFRGLTADVSYRHRVGELGTFGLGVNYFYLKTLETQVGNGDVSHSAGDIGYPHHSATANLTWEKGPFNALVQAQYFGKSSYDVDAAANRRNISGVGAWTVYNATLGFDINKQFGLKLIVDNLLDSKPPYPSPAGGGSVTYFSGILGRYFRVAASMKF